MIQGKNKWGEFMKYKLFALIFIISIISCDKPEDLIDSADVVDGYVRSEFPETFIYKVKNYGTSNVVGWYIKVDFEMIDRYDVVQHVHADQYGHERLEPGEKSEAYLLHAIHGYMVPNDAERSFPRVVGFEPEFE